MISKNTARVRLPRRRRVEDEGPWGVRPAPAIPQQWVAASAPGLDPVIAAAAQPVDPAAEIEMETAWRAYGEVVDVLGAITNAARLAERGICPDTQIANIDLLAADLEAAWARWEAAHHRVIGLPSGAEPGA